MDATIIDRATARKIVEGYKGNQFFTVTFRKRGDGSLRKMNCRKGVKKDVSGEGRKYDPQNHDLVCVRDVQKKAHRMIPLESITAISITGRTYKVQ